MSVPYQRYSIDLPTFNGPLDLLLHLIEREELDITAISLMQVTQQYLAQIERLKENRIENLIDFLVMAARLVQIKSRALLPQTPLTSLEDEAEEDPAEALIRQLRQYKRFKRSAAWLQQRETQGLRTYLRLAPPPKLEKTLDLSGITTDSLRTIMQDILARGEELEDSVAIVQPRRITIEKQLVLLRRKLGAKRPFHFHSLLTKSADRTEVAITLLALLELIKRREAQATQPHLFGPVEIHPTPTDLPPLPFSSQTHQR